MILYSIVRLKHESRTTVVGLLVILPLGLLLVASLQRLESRVKGICHSLLAIGARHLIGGAVPWHGVRDARVFVRLPVALLLDSASSSTIANLAENSLTLLRHSRHTQNGVLFHFFHHK